MELERQLQVRYAYVSHAKETSTWIISDPHFDHKNIIRYTNRPFWSIEQMNEHILWNWNNKIKSDDLVFFLGDMAFGRGSRKARWWLTQLNGRKIYLKGSHDKEIRPTSVLDKVLFVCDCVVLRTDACTYLLVHDSFNKPYWFHGWVVHGHYHDTRPYLDTKWKRVNVSVEMTDYKPITVRQLVTDTIGMVKGGY